MIKNIFAAAAALAFGIAGIFIMFGGWTFLPPLAGLFGMFICGIILARQFSPYMADALGVSFYYSHGKLDRRPEHLARLEGMAAAGEPAEAVAELEKILKKSFNQTDARMLLAKILLNKFRDSAAAENILKEFFDSPKHVSGSASLDLLLLYGDLLDEHGKRGQAIRCYECELKRGRFAAADRQLLLNRLNALKDS